MNKEAVQWIDISNDGLLESFARKTGLNPASLQVEGDVLVLPLNRFFGESPNSHNLLPGMTKDVLMTLQEGGVQAQLYSDGKPERELILKSADIILPILMFLSSNALNVGLNLLSSWIYDRLAKRAAYQESPTIRVEYVSIGQGGTIAGWRRVQGPASEVASLLAKEANLLQSNTLAKIPKKHSQQATRNKTKKLNSPYQTSQANAAISVARELLQEAEHFLKEGETDVAERLFRKGLSKIREAVLWEPNVTSHRKYLHAVGQQVHNIFGCHLEFRDSMYWVTCPVMLSHTRGGFSIGGSSKTICSICGEDVLSCPHIKGRIYDQIPARRFKGICNICRSSSECGHEEGQVYDGVEACGIITEIDLDHVAFVTNPANPLCAIYSYSVPRSDLEEMMPEVERSQIVYGETVIYCHHCLICDGT